jgi:hypothetical protein
MSDEQQGDPSAPPRVLPAALEYAGLGLRVIPLRAGTKRPRTRKWQKAATTDPETIQSWFAKYPASNLGICTGQGLLVLDIDTKNNGRASLDSLLAEHGPLPETAEARTGTGGSHYYFRVDPALRLGNRANLCPGLDIRGEGGQIVAPPSLHPETGRGYEWVQHPRQGIAPAPEWLVGLLTGSEAGQGRRSRPHAKRTRPLGTARRGDAGQLLEEILDKFPIPAPGHRHVQMVRAVGSLVGRGYPDDLIERVLMSWWEHHHARGVTRTSGPAMLQELGECLASTRTNPAFRPATSEVDHQALCARIRLDAAQRELLRSPIGSDELGTKLLVLVDSELGTNSPNQLSTCKRLTLIQDRLCETADEEAFVESLIVHVEHKRINVGDTAILMTHPQLNRIARARFGREWSPPQIERHKAKYVTRPGKPARRFELLRELRKGGRKGGQVVGIPSEYETTGIEWLLKPEARRIAEGAIACVA